MLDPKNVIGSQEVWEDFVTNAEMESTPFLDFITKGPKMEGLDISYQAEEYRDPRENSHVNGTPVTGFKAAGEGRGRLRSLIHYSTNTAAITALHQDALSIAGINNEMAREINKGNKELSRDFEAWLMDDADHREDNKVVGYETRTVNSWVASGAQALYPVPEAFRPPAASISATATASLTEETILNLLESIGQVTKSNRGVTAFVGTRLKRAFNNMPLFTPSSTLVGGSPTGATGINYTKPLNDRAVGRVIERYDSDFGPVDLVINHWLHNLTGNAVEKAYSGLFLHQDMWQLRWHKKPTWYKKTYEGGAYEAFCEAIWCVVCKNPVGEAKYNPQT